MRRQRSGLTSDDLGCIDQQYILDRIQIDDNGCWIWTGYVNKHLGRGYAFPGRQGSPLLAYRASYVAFVGPIPEGKQINHHCDVPRCVNPKHIYAGTPADNARDAIERGLSKPPPPMLGEEHPAAYPDAVVDEIRARYQAGEMQKDLAAEFGVSISQVRLWISAGARGREPIRRARQACGTYSGHAAHRYRGEEPCDPCRAAYSERQRTYRERRKVGSPTTSAA